MNFMEIILNFKVAFFFIENLKIKLILKIFFSNFKTVQIQEIKKNNIKINISNLSLIIILI